MAQVGVFDMMPLDPEHLSDLRKSGLSDATITACRFTSLRPHDIKLAHVTSAYELRYFGLDGSVNGFARWKLFPALKTEQGTMKYYQPVNSDPHLYVPPLLDWSAIATDAARPILLTEGEKKAVALCQRELACAGIGGVWNWRQRLETGERLLIPTLDLFKWQDRMVELIPDSDAWRAEKLLDVLGAFYALAMELVRRGARVRFVKLPDRPDHKVGSDDWLVAIGEEWPHLWPELERVMPDAPILKKVAAWWQRWKEKRVLEETLRNPDEMEIQEASGLYTVIFPPHSARFVFDRLNDVRGGVSAELTVTHGQTELLGETDIGLKSDSSRDKIARTLKGLVPSVPWKRLLERACTATFKRHRVGEPIIVLEPAASVHVPFFLNPLIYRGHPSMIYAPGGSLKSIFALYLALLACHGASQHGLAALKCPVLLLDWELNKDTVEGRLQALRAGHPELSQQTPYYRRCERPLHQEVAPIVRFVAAHGVQLLFLDSAAMACGGDLNSPDTVIALTRALRTIGCASLLLAHISKMTPEGQERTAYGSVFFRELARNVFELERIDGDTPAHHRLILSHTKNNFGPRRPTPLAFEVAFEGEATCVTAYDPTEEPAFERKMPMEFQIRNLLEDGTPRSSKEITFALGAKLSTVRVELSRGKKHGKWSLVTVDGIEKWTTLKSS